MQTAIIGIKPPGTTIEANEMIDWMMFKYEIIHFEFNSYTLSEKAGPILRSKACWIKTQDKSTQIIVTGHCDQRGTEAYNKYLGAMRANAVKQYLVKCGVPFEQVRIVSAGDQHPLVQGQSESDWALNRRVEFQNR